MILSRTVVHKPLKRKHPEALWPQNDKTTLCIWAVIKKLGDDQTVCSTDIWTWVTCGFVMSRVEVCEDLCWQDNPIFMWRIITGNQSWRPSDQTSASKTEEGAPCLSFSSTFVGLWTMDLSLSARLSTLSSTAPIWSIWMKTFNTNNLNCGAAAARCSNNQPTQDFQKPEGGLGEWCITAESDHFEEETETTKHLWESTLILDPLKFDLTVNSALTGKRLLTDLYTQW